MRVNEAPNSGPISLSRFDRVAGIGDNFGTVGTTLFDKPFVNGKGIANPMTIFGELLVDNRKTQLLQTTGGVATKSTGCDESLAPC